ncbi:MAG: type VI secretion system membrane subunit TssM [Proteobacteria bacterium]|uniref:type VI secretion system membrane subunit TssM n=1 Tax=Aquabacterium sp. TaxID=1872578 RepID=UPI0035C75E5F|nr:type VI secretion system membrane subunit TssM [Pseudomonadota bacterium]
MQGLWLFLLHPRTLAVLGVSALLLMLWLGADALQVGLAWSLGVAVFLGLAWLGVWWWRRRQLRHAGQALAQALDADAQQAVQRAARAGRGDEAAALRARMAEAVKRIKTSRLGDTSGTAALYALPWYAIIGNPTAGKSSAIVKSGLTFPFAENTDPIVQGIGGTRHCDWYFTTEGILLDTAGRYAVHEEDHREWLGFLKLLKTHRPRAPLNGVIIAVSIAELLHQSSDAGIELARKLRQRVQELTEHLEVFVPVYVVFTKADLIAGFVDFFEDRDRAERDKVWGATLACEVASPADAATLFDQHMDALCQGLKDASVARMTLHRGEQLPPGVLTFPLEFAALRPTLRTFLHTLFEDNPYQFRPVFRGFYFTSAVQEGQSTSRASRRVAEQFGVQLQAGTAAAVYSTGGFFLKELFSRVIFADRLLVQQYTSRRKMRLRLASFAGGMLLLGLLLSGWTWSYLGNRALVADVQTDLIKAQRVQHQRVDLASRLEALEILQDRLEQVQRMRDGHAWTLGLGLYQGEAIERHLKEAYFHGLQALLLQPSAQGMQAYLSEVNRHATELLPQASPADAVDAAGGGGAAAGGATASPYVSASRRDVGEAYNALKAYLMLGERERLEPGHMADQLTRFWREWLDDNRGALPREAMVRHAERILSFALTQMGDPAFPQLTLDAALVDQSRDNLRRVVKGLPARERAYADIKARAATRHAAVTVAALLGESGRDLLSGSQAVSGAFTRQAWEGYVKEAIEDAAHHTLQSTDWVLKTAMADDLTLEGSPQQIQKALTQLYKADYAQAWQKFLQGISVQDFQGFEQAVQRMGRLGDPTASPLGKLLHSVHEQTGWDNPGVLQAGLAAGQSGLVAWFKATVLGMAPAPLEVKLDTGRLAEAGTQAAPLGVVGQRFAGIHRLMVPRDGGRTLAQAYLNALSGVRVRFHQMKNQGDAGPPARQFMHQTLEGQGELAEALKLVDEQLLTGLGDAQRDALRPLLVRPLVQAFGALVKPTEAELNRSWMAQVYEPYQRTLATKYPYDRRASLEASPAEVAAVFGVEGAVARFVEQSLGGLVLRRGGSLSARTWADLGVRLRPDFIAGLGGWMAPLGGVPSGAASGANAGMGGGQGDSIGTSGASSGGMQTTFQILPLPSPGLTEYTLDIDGQVLRYRQGRAGWVPFVWPGPGLQGVKVSGVTFDGRGVGFFHEAGRFGLEKMIQSARRRKLDGQVFELSWPRGDVAVTVQLRVISNSASVTDGDAVGMGAAAHGGAGAGMRAVTLPAIVAGEDDAAVPQGAVR